MIPGEKTKNRGVSVDDVTADSLTSELEEGYIFLQDLLVF